MSEFGEVAKNLMRKVLRKEKPQSATVPDQEERLARRQAMQETRNTYLAAFQEHTQRVVDKYHLQQVVWGRNAYDTQLEQTVYTDPSGTFHGEAHVYEPHPFVVGEVSVTRGGMTFEGERMTSLRFSDTAEYMRIDLNEQEAVEHIQAAGFQAVRAREGSPVSRPENMEEELKKRYMATEMPDRGYVYFTHHPNSETSGGDLPVGAFLVNDRFLKGYYFKESGEMRLVLPNEVYVTFNAQGELVEAGLGGMGTKKTEQEVLVQKMKSEGK